MTYLFKMFAVTDSENDIERLELKVNFLILISAIQALVLTFWILSVMLLPSSGTVVIALLALGGFLFLFRKSIPSWSGNIFRMIVKRFSGDKDKSGDTNIK